MFFFLNLPGNYIKIVLRGGMCVQFTKDWEILEGGFLTYSAYVAGMVISLLFHKPIFSFNVKKISLCSVNKTKKKKKKGFVCT